ncbi:MAG TPA: HlyD family secretion protein [Steroidobacteraceae bacterium]|nr:HlyD family secretion protein [Steroidobacteraceae bacterium]
MAGRDPFAAFRAAPDWIWRALIFLLALGVLLLITTRWRVWETDASSQSTDDAYLQSDLTPISARVSGYVRDMPVQDFEHVHKGQLLAQLADDDYRASVAQLTASVAAASAQIGTLKAQRSLQDSTVQAARAGVAAVQASLEQNARDLARQQKLMSTGSSSTEAGEKLRTLAAQLSAQLEQSKAQLSGAQHQLLVLDAQRVQAEATLAAQQAALDLARINLGYTRITAPEDGFIGQRQVKPGQLVSVGGQITTLTPLPRIWVIANYKETQLTRMRVGAAARIAVDTFPGHTLRGHVLAFAPGAGSQFALLPPDNATGNFTKVVQRVGVKIAIDDADGLTDVLRPGMSVVAMVNTDGRRQ